MVYDVYRAFTYVGRAAKSWPYSCGVFGEMVSLRVPSPLFSGQALSGKLSQETVTSLPCSRRILPVERQVLSAAAARQLNMRLRVASNQTIPKQSNARVSFFCIFLERLFACHVGFSCLGLGVPKHNRAPSACTECQTVWALLSQTSLPSPRPLPHNPRKRRRSFRPYSANSPHCVLAQANRCRLTLSRAMTRLAACGASPCGSNQDELLSWCARKVCAPLSHVGAYPASALHQRCIVRKLGVPFCAQASLTRGQL